MSDYLHVNTQARKAHRYDFGGYTKETTIEHLLARAAFCTFLDHEASSVHHENPIPLFMILFTLTRGNSRIVQFWLIVVLAWFSLSQNFIARQSNRSLSGEYCRIYLAYVKHKTPFLFKHEKS
jgi:hypothetical protein